MAPALSLIVLWVVSVIAVMVGATRAGCVRRLEWPKVAIASLAATVAAAATWVGLSAVVIATLPDVDLAYLIVIAGAVLIPPVVLGAFLSVISDIRFLPTALGLGMVSYGVVVATSYLVAIGFYSDGVFIVGYGYGRILMWGGVALALAMAIVGDIMARTSSESPLQQGVPQDPQGRFPDAYLLMENAHGGAGMRVSLQSNGPNILGRGSREQYGVTIRVDDARASRRHAIISRDDLGRWYIEDAQSDNGTLIGDRRVTGGQRMPLKDGDVITIGRTSITFRLS